MDSALRLAKKHAPSGYSVLELLIVLSFSSMLLFAAVSADRRILPKLRGHAEAELLKNMVAQASILAIRSQEQVTITLESRQALLASKGKRWLRVSLSELEVKYKQQLVFYPSAAAQPATLSFGYADRECKLRVSLRARGTLVCG